MSDTTQGESGRWAAARAAIQAGAFDGLREEARARRTVRCSETGCDAMVVRIERYHVPVSWELGPLGEWTMGTFDSGTHFHLFCQDGHEVKSWGRDLAKRLQAVVYPADTSEGPGAEQGRNAEATGS